MELSDSKQLCMFQGSRKFFNDFCAPAEISNGGESAKVPVKLVSLFFKNAVKSACTEGTKASMYSLTDVATPASMSACEGLTTTVFRLGPPVSSPLSLGALAVTPASNSALAITPAPAIDAVEGAASSGDLRFCGEAFGGEAFGDIATREGDDNEEPTRTS